jgi:hypothetical protein
MSLSVKPAWQLYDLIHKEGKAIDKMTANAFREGGDMAIWWRGRKACEIWQRLLPKAECSRRQLFE